MSDQTHDRFIAADSLALSHRLEHDHIVESGERAALTMIRHAAIYRALLAPFDPTLQAGVPAAVHLDVTNTP